MKRTSRFLLAKTAIQNFAYLQFLQPGLPMKLIEKPRTDLLKIFDLNRKPRLGRSTKSGESFYYRGFSQS